MRDMHFSVYMFIVFVCFVSIQLASATYFTDGRKRNFTNVKQKTQPTNPI